MKKTMFCLIVVLLEVFFFAQGESENNMYEEINALLG